MATERSGPTLLHELVVAHDERHSYMQRMNSLAGPGAYTIPSTFRRPPPNMLLRVVQHESYGREFSRQKRTLTTASTTLEETPCQLCLVTAADTHRDRRNQLRKLLCLAPVDRWDEVAKSKPTVTQSPRAVADPASSRAASPDGRVRRSPSSRPGSNWPSRRYGVSADLDDIVADFGEQPSATGLSSEDEVRVQQQLCCFRAPLTYQHFLMSTSYLERLKRLQHRQQRAAGQ